MPAHNTIPHTARRCLATWSHHIGMEMHWWEEGGKKRHSEGTQEEKWITVRGRVDCRRRGRENPAVERALFPYPANLERLNAVQAAPKEIRQEVIASDTEKWENLDASLGTLWKGKDDTAPVSIKPQPSLTLKWNMRTRHGRSNSCRTQNACRSLQADV